MNIELISELESLDCSNMPLFSFDGIKTYARCVKNYDADTVTLVLKQNSEFIKINCRIVGIDSPEMRSKNAELKAHAYAGKQFLSELILNKIVFVEITNFDKYGRALINLYTCDTKENIKDMLIEKKFAIAYNGDTKMTEQEQMNYYFSV